MVSTLRTIAIDIDDVLADTLDAIRLHVNKNYNVDLLPEHYRMTGEYWGYYERIWISQGLTDPDIFNNFVNDMINDRVNIKLLPGASLAIEKLSKTYKIIFITSRDSEWEVATRKWFKENFKKENIELYFARSHKDNKAKTKGQLCIDLGATLLIDDNIAHCQSAIDVDIDTILFGEYGWHTAIPKGATYCKDWNSVLEYMDGR